MVLLVNQGHQELVSLEVKDQLDLRDQPDSRDLKDPQDQLVLQELTVAQDLSVRPEQLEQMDNKELQALQVKMVPQDNQDP